MGCLFRAIVLGVSAWSSMMSSSHALYAESPADEPPRYCTVFTHLIKSGGSTLKKQLYQSCHRDRARKPGLVTGDWHTTPASRFDAIHNASVIVGPSEMVRGALEAIGRDCEYFTMLRNPIDRLVSSFYYCPRDHDVQGRPSKWCGDSTSTQESLQARLLEYAELDWGNRMFLVMTPPFICDVKFELCEREHAREKELMPQNIDTKEGWSLYQDIMGVLSTYTAVGIFEELLFGTKIQRHAERLGRGFLLTLERELSMRLFNAKVTSPVRDWDANVAVNAGPESAVREELLNWARTNVKLHTTLAADLMLYDYGVTLFRQQTRDTLGVQWT